MNWVVGILATLSLLNIGLLLVFLRIRNIILNEREGRVFAVVEYYSGDKVCKARGWVFKNRLNLLGKVTGDFDFIEVVNSSTSLIKMTSIFRIVKVESLFKIILENRSHRNG